MARFSGKNILIIGGTKGIGLALQQNLTAAGANVLLAARNAGTAGSPAQFVAFDALLEDASALKAAVPEILHGLVYCPGSINLKPFARLTPDEFRKDFELNVLGAVKVLQALQKNLKAANGSSVVLFSTVAAKMGMPFHASVAASKAALEGLARALAAEWAAAQIRVNVIAPSLTDTSLAEPLLNTPEKRESAGKRHPLNRIGKPEELAALAAFLLSEEAGWMTGQTIGLDGGLSSLKV